MTTIIDLFAGPGGWDHGLREHLGIGDVVGVELDDNCVATRREANLLTRQGDVAATDPWSLGTGTPEGLIASPPCQPFSRAGKRDGMRDLIRLGLNAYRMSEGDVHSVRLDRWSDERAPLILEPLRWAVELEPTWIALEQVPPCLPMWEVLEDVLEAFGYSVWTGILNAADYGVPQTRQRAFLMAHLDAFVSPPEPTHGETPGLGQRPWVTMAEALPHRALPDWSHGRPSTTVVGTFKPEVQAAPGWRNAGDGPRQDAPNSVHLEAWERGAIQSFPVDYPWQGSKTAISRQIGDAVPPLLAAHVVGALTGIDMREAPYAIPA